MKENKNMKALEVVSEKQIKEFDKIKLNLTKIFEKQNFNNNLNLVYGETKEFYSYNKNNTIVIKALSKIGFELIKEFLTTENINEYPKLNYTLTLNTDLNKEISVNLSSNFNSEKFSKILNVLKSFKMLDEEYFEILIKNNYPVTLRNNHIEFILAPITN